MNYISKLKARKKKNPFTHRQKDPKPVPGAFSEHTKNEPSHPRVKRHALSELRYNQVLVIWKFLSRTKQTAGFLAHGLRQCRLPNSSVAAFPHDIVIPHTVTGSHRPHTCFPFTLWPSTIGLQRHRLPHVIQLRTHYKIDTLACQRTKCRKYNTLRLQLPCFPVISRCRSGYPNNFSAFVI